MKVLVTGGAGYVGGVSVDAILAAGHDVVVLDDLTTGHRAIAHPDARLVVGSYAHDPTIRSLLETERPDAILHCAARSLVGESTRDPGRYYRDNVAGGIVLLEAARATGVDRVVFSSTAAVYGVPDATPIEEDAPLRPINPYGETKRTFEGALRWYGAAYGLRSASLRYFNVGGRDRAAGRGPHPETHLIPNVLIAAEGGPPLTLFGEDYPTPDGTASATTSMCSTWPMPISPPSRRRPTRRTDRSSATSGRRPGSPCATSCGRPRPSWAARSRQSIGPRRAGDPPVLVASNARARAVLGWVPRRSTLDEMVGSAWAWRLANPEGYRD